MNLAQVISNLQTVINFDVRDWAANRRDAYIYGVLVGWGKALDEVAKQHGWDEGTIRRIREARALIASRTNHERGPSTETSFYPGVIAVEGKDNAELDVLKDDSHEQ